MDHGGGHLFCCNYNRSAFRHRVPRVHRQIKKGKFELVWIGLRLGEPQWKMSIDLYRRAERTLQKSRHSKNQFRHVKWFEHEFLAARERKHTLSEGRAAVRSLQRIVEK